MMESTSETLPEYDQDERFDEDIDTTGITCFVSIIGATIGAGLSATGLAIYYFIINNF